MCPFASLPDDPEISQSIPSGKGDINAIWQVSIRFEIIGTYQFHLCNNYAHNQFPKGFNDFRLERTHFVEPTEQLLDFGTISGPLDKLGVKKEQRSALVHFDKFGKKTRMLKCNLANINK